MSLKAELLKILTSEAAELVADAVLDLARGKRDEQIAGARRMRAAQASAIEATVDAEFRADHAKRRAAKTKRAPRR